MGAAADNAAVARNPEWLPHRYDPVRDAVHFVHATRDEHRAATFLTDEHLACHGEPVVIARDAALAAAPPSSPVHFIFHSAFCCSTLLTRALDIEGTSMGLKEPVILNDLAGWRHRGGPPRDVARGLDHALALLGRPFAPGEAVIVKPSNLINVFAPVMLAMRPDARALLLYAPLAAYVGSIARKGMEGRLWVRDLLGKLIKDGLINLGFEPSDYLGLTDLQAAAVGWLAQHALFARLARDPGALRVRTLDSETLVERPADTMLALDALFDLKLGAERAGSIAAGPEFVRHAKTGGAFDRVARAREQREALAAHGDEIVKVVTWAEAVAANAGLSLALPAQLLA